MAMCMRAADGCDALLHAIEHFVAETAQCEQESSAGC
jgi:alcohol dehydrogenase class IV